MSLVRNVDVGAAHGRLIDGRRLLDQRNVRAAIRKLEEATALGLDPLEGLLERWVCRMLLGDFEGAWQETDRIETLRRAGAPVQGHLMWDGRHFSQQQVILHCNHGLGDAIQYIRYAPMLRRQCARLVVKAQPVLLPLLNNLPDIDECLPDTAASPPGIEMECTELPYIFRTVLETIPRDVPYIVVPGEPGAVERKEAAAGIESSREGLLKVGLAWAAGPWNKTRSIPLRDFTPLAAAGDVLFFNLQWGPEREEAQNIAALRVHDFARPIAYDMVATARAVGECDLVISVDSMIAHLAGALGKPVWVLLKFDSDWRWMLDRSDSPWYPGMRLFRQRRPGDWSAPLVEAQQALSELASLREQC